jgi:hypothetical protein
VVEFMVVPRGTIGHPPRFVSLRGALVYKGADDVSHEFLDTQPALPQLYIVDFAGHIRFHVTSFDDGHVFARKLDWMIEATLHEAER